MKIFLISPVRNINEEEQKKIADYVKKLESKGHKVHWPIRDTDQNDPIGIDICNQNFKSISNADEIHIWFNPTSTGTLFDLGGAFMIWHMYKDIKFVFANKNDFVDDPTGGKSFFKVLKYLDEYKEE